MRTALMEPAPSVKEEWEAYHRPLAEKANRIYSRWGEIWAEVFRKANEMMNEERK